jgi:RHS repeat-associated protein
MTARLALWSLVLFASAPFTVSAQQAPAVVASPMSCPSCGGSNVPPQIHLDTPDDGQQFIEGTSVALQATASDYDDGVQSVTFMIDGNVFLEDFTAPYSTTWTATGVGSHSINARVVDNAGYLVHNSDPASITVVANQAPAVTLTEPDGGETYNTGAAVTFTATATDSDGTINRVEFLVDGTEVGQDTSSPYAYTWTAATGAHTVQARAVDNLGLSHTTATAAITVNTAPAVSLTAPTNGQVYAYGATVPMTATASDPDGTINRVEFLIDGAEVGQDTASPYAFNWPSTVGSHTAQARAIDNSSAVKTTTAISFRANQLPAISLTGPANGTIYTTGNIVPMTATASDSDGTINRVEFLVDGTEVGQDTISPYAYNWTATTGTHSVVARAVDNNSGTRTTAAISVTANPPNQLPTVSLTAPTNGQVFAYGATVPMTATASDPDGTINRVEFLIDGAEVGQDTASPYAFNWPSTVGSHTAQARAIDNSSAVKTTTAISFRANQLPAVSLTGPANGTIYTTGNIVPMTATASDSDGTINRVEFLVDGTEVGQDTIGPYAFNWTATTGTHSVVARAVDNNSGTRTTAAISVTANPPNQLPTVSLTAPANGASYIIGTTVTMNATASDSDGTINRVEFLVDGAEVGQDTLSPYTYGWIATTGSHTVQARAVDDDSGQKVTTSITITGVANQLPTVNLTAPTNGGIYTTGNAVPMTATASDADGTINRVEFLVDGAEVGQDTSSPYAYNWTATTGSHTVQARAIDDHSGQKVTASITIAVNPPNQPPTVSLTAPTNGAGFTTGTAVAMGATASDGDGTIDRVEFWVDGAEVGQDASSPYTYSWTATNGSHTVQARAVDDDSASNTTASISITVTDPPPPPVTVTRSYTYNAYQQLCGVQEPETGTTLMGYDAAGNLAWSASGLAAGTACDAEGDTAAILARKAVRTYDARNRVSSLTFPDGNGNQTWTYTDTGLPETVVTFNDGGLTSVTNSYLYNKRHMPVAETLQADTNTWSAGYGYDANGHLSALTYPDSLTVAYAPNALGQPTQAGSYATAVSYFPNGAIKQFTYGNGIVHSLTQNARGLPEISQDVNGSTAIHQDEYAYDQVGNVLAIIDAATGQSQHGNRDMTYDGLNRLATTTSPMFGTATYAYDVVDNLTHVQVTAGSQARDQDYCYDAANHLTNIKTGGCFSGPTVVGLGYDVQGNLSNKSGVAYTFDYGNRMRAGGPETYRYDVQGRRVRSSSSAGLVYSLYAQSGQLLFQRDERSGKRRQYVYLGGSLVAETAVPLAGGTATVTYQHTDALGSPVATTNSAKTVLQRSEYEPYGYLLNRPMEDGPGYTGHVTDAATGLVYMQQRYYDPGIGRFLSRDPVTAYNSGDMRQFNGYGYAYNNPYRFTDPDGRCPVCLIPLIPPALAALGEAAAYTGAILVGLYVGDKISDHIQRADSIEGAQGKLSDGKSPADGADGKKGVLVGDGGREQAEGDFDGVDGTEIDTGKDGVRVKVLEGGGRVEIHDSTGKNPSVEKGTRTIKVQDQNGKVKQTIRYPEPKQEVDR